MRFDEAALRIELAVADLLEPQLLRSIGFANRGGFERLWLGQAIHGRYRRSARFDRPTGASRCRARSARGGRWALRPPDACAAPTARSWSRVKSVRREGSFIALRGLYERRPAHARML
jgi:hypothetical protein